MSVQVQVRIYVDWSGPRHVAAGPALACAVCSCPTTSTTKDGVRCHRWCFEDVVAREVTGLARARIVEERVPAGAGGVAAAGRGRPCQAAPPRRVRVGGSLFRPVVPAGAVYIGRAVPGLPRSLYANPHRVGKPCRACHGTVHDLAEAGALYATHLRAHPELVAQARRELAGRTVACWCPPERTCHGDVLLCLIGEPS